MQLATADYSDQRAKFDYRPDVDGLRALAVLGVMLYHAGFGLTGGFVGVDVFFVISGYLITQGILRESEVGRFRLQRFWERRIRRILPAALATIVTVLVTGYVILLPSDYYKLAQAAFSQLFFFGNIYYWYDTGYFTGEAELKPLLHTWSLAVEEQFYIVLPLVLLLLLRFGRRVAIFGLLAITLASFSACVILTPRLPSASFYLLPTRGWELLVGCLLAFREANLKLSEPGNWAEPRTWLEQMIATIALGGVLGSMLMLKSDGRFPGYLASLPVASTAVLLDLHCRSRTWVQQLLRLPWLVGIGLISYSLYLWHWPCLAFVRYLYGSAENGPMVVPFLAAFPIAYASWKWIENPYRRQTNWRGWRLFFAAGLAILVPITMSLVIWQQKGFPRRLSTARTQPPSSRESMTTSYDTSPIDFKIDELPLLGDRNVEPSFLVWGDSHALALAPILNEVASQYGKSGRLVARGGTPPLIAAWRGDSVAAGADSGLRWSANALEAMGARQWEAIVVIAGWQIYVHETGLRDASSGTSSSETSAGVLKRQLQRTAAAMPTTSKVFWLQPAPRQSTDLARALGNRALNKWAPEVGKGIDREEYDQQVSEIREAFQSLTQLPGHNWVDVTSNFFTEQGRARLFDGTEFCYLDDNHVSQAGARLYFGDAIREIMETIGGADRKERE